MDHDTKKLLGRVLGEVLRVQKQQGICCESNATIYGLLNGFESAIDDVMQDMGGISRDQVKAVADVLEPYFQRKKNLSGFYDIEKELQEVGVDRGEAIQILTFFKLGRQFEDVIAKMDSTNSPGECRTFAAWPDDLNREQ